MKKIIEGKTYNTETALLLGDWQNLWKGDYHYCREELYRTKKGTYFLYGEGGALSCYARYIGGSATGGADFQVLSDREAKEWAEKSCLLRNTVRYLVNQRKGRNFYWLALSQNCSWLRLSGNEFPY